VLVFDDEDRGCHAAMLHRVARIARQAELDARLAGGPARGTLADATRAPRHIRPPPASRSP
jgi:hypothetical protein